LFRSIMIGRLFPNASSTCSILSAITYASVATATVYLRRLLCVITAYY
jgi:hypothetical protein